MSREKSPFKGCFRAGRCRRVLVVPASRSEKSLLSPREDYTVGSNAASSDSDRCPHQTERWEITSEALVRDCLGGGVINLQRAADPQTAGSRPASSIHIGVFDLVLGIDAAFALASLSRSWNEIHRTCTSKRCPSVMPGSNARALEVRVHFSLLFSG